MIVVLAVAAGLVWKLRVFKSSHAVPDLVGLTTAQAASKVTSGSYTLDIVDVTSSKPANQIVSQSPSAGTNAKSGSVIDVQVSTGPGVVSIPRSLIGESCPSAVAQLKNRGVTATCPAAQRVYSNVTPVNRIARVLYGTTVNPLAVPKGATVVLERSKGTPGSTTTTTTTSSSTTTTTTAPTTTVAVPNVVGDTYAQASPP